MEITADLNGKNYTLGRGKVLFDRFDQNAVINNDTKGEGYRYLGNSPAFSTTGSTEDLDHFDSDNGVKVKDDAVQLTMDRSGKVEIDNIDRENIALMFQGLASDLATVAAVGVVETLTAKKGRFYQLGESQANPSGNRMVSNVVVKKGSPGFATVVAAAGNYEYDADLGHLFILADAADVPDDTVLQVTYDVAASSRGQVISGSTAIYGQIKFIANNPKGVNRDYYYPYVKLSPDGDYNLKGDDWLKMGFNFEILKRGSLEAVYVDERAVAV
jgi:hypothetical protein